MGIFSKLKINKDTEATAVVASQNSDASSTAVAESPVKKVLKATGNAHTILKRAIVSEKAAIMAAVDTYVFEVAYKANKQMVKDAIFKVYGVRPIRVNMITLNGKRVGSGKFAGSRSDWKKAMVTMPKGKKIEIYEGV